MKRMKNKKEFDEAIHSNWYSNHQCQKLIKNVDQDSNYYFKNSYCGLTSMSLEKSHMYGVCQRFTRSNSCMFSYSKNQFVQTIQC